MIHESPLDPRTIIHQSPLEEIRESELRGKRGQRKLRMNREQAPDPLGELQHSDSRKAYVIPDSFSSPSPSSFTDAPNPTQPRALFAPPTAPAPKPKLLPGTGRNPPPSAPSAATAQRWQDFQDLERLTSDASKYPYMLHRTKENGLPVYQIHDHKIHVTYTIIRGIFGKPKALRDDLLKTLFKSMGLPRDRLRCQIDEDLGKRRPGTPVSWSLKMKGLWRQHVILWLEARGF